MQEWEILGIVIVLSISPIIVSVIQILNPILPKILPRIPGIKMNKNLTIQIPLLKECITLTTLVLKEWRIPPLIFFY